MNKIIIFLALIAVIVVGTYLITISNQQNVLEVLETSETAETSQLKVVSTEIKAVADDSDDGGIYATFSNGESKLIAASDNPKTIENYFEIVTYREAFISPNKKFVAVEGSQFEDAIVQVYEVETDILHEVIYGVVTEWTPEGLLKIESCELSGENCINKISVSAETPWIVESI